jgi:hypothetical protein
MPFRCPACGALIYNRAYPKCERCGKDLPPGLLFSEQEKQQKWNDFLAARESELKKNEADGEIDEAADWDL